MSEGDYPAYLVALDETRRILETQRQWVESSDNEILSVIRINILALGAILTLIVSAPNMVREALPWISLSGFLLICSSLILAFIYRSVTLYVGFGDQGVEDPPPEKLSYDHFVQVSDPQRLSDSLPDTPPTSEAFRASLLNEHRSGISHNNIQIKHRSQIRKQAVILFLNSLLILGAGLLHSIETSVTIFTAVLIISIALCGIAIYIIIKTVGLIGRFIQTKADPNRLSYEYSFERKYPLLSQLCSFVLTYLYDPIEEEW